MNYLQVVPDGTYFVWQLYVQMLNFRKLDIEKDAIILVAIKQKPSEQMKKFEEWTNARVHYYVDTRTQTDYPSSVRPHVIAKYMRDFGSIDFFYHDQDIIFLDAPPDLTYRPMNSMTCYVAPGAKSYLHTPYIKQFKKYIYPSMCEIVGIDEKLVEANDLNCGGAQYIINGTDAAFWDKVERDSNGLYEYCHEICTNGLRKYNPDQKLETYKIQYWCADMWALFWNLLLAGKAVVHSPEIDFSWPWEKLSLAKPVMHNAGITGQTQYRGKDKVKTYFYKSGYNTKMPFGDNFDFVPSDCVQRPYVDLINEVHQLGIVA